MAVSPLEGNGAGPGMRQNKAFIRQPQSNHRISINAYQKVTGFTYQNCLPAKNAESLDVKSLERWCLPYGI